MFISLPKEFFVPVLFSGEFRLNTENNNMEYDSKRKYLSDTIGLIEEDEFRRDEELTNNYYGNIKDKDIEEQVIKYIKGFMRFIKELKDSNCLGNDEKESIDLVNFYGRKFRDIYNMYKNEVLRVRRPLTPGDVDAFIDFYIDKISNLYNENLARLNCKTLNYDTIEAIIDEILSDARNILRDQIEELNCRLINKRVECKNSADIETSFENNGDIYNEIDNEFVNTNVNM